ncbi:elongation of very long chain fatty acids protein 7-like [Nymphalis io]|uniref:elongation of very long chain fatty acids protein 7-like n=1 Tax=Inachis io TaxID=171585 RepID=UPI0021677641|nr:elongation of very long chain fatty acids protein 7-like [Nymphalis io]
MTLCFEMFPQLPKGHLSFVEKWPLMNPYDMGFIIVTYFAFILKIGPLLMEKRQPLQLNKFLILYNMVKVINSSILAFKFFSYILDKGLFPRKCVYDGQTMFIIAVLYWKYMATKILDLVDTIVFVVRKKNDQITFLHVYHHVFMVLVTWCSLKYDPTDHWAFMAIVNCVIHIIMYTYYGISALGPRYRRYLWWKKYLTIMQLLQFVLIFTHVVIQTYTSECPMSSVTYWVGIFNLSLFICLFTDFYNKRYRAKLKDTSFACTRQVVD